MHRFFSEPTDWNLPLVLLRPAEAHHLFHVLRLRQGDRLEVFDGCGRFASAVAPECPPASVLRYSGVELRVESVSVRPPPRTQLVLVQAVAKQKAMEAIIEKATELGASRVVPFVAERSVSRVEESDVAVRIERWNRIVLNAAKQCGSMRFPVVEPVCAVAAAADRTARLAFAVVGSLERDAEPLANVLAAAGHSPVSAGLVIGPEGDLTSAELAAFRAAGARAVSFGERTLRVETAAVHGLGVLGFWFGPNGLGSS